MNAESEKLPHWDLTNVYSSLNSPDFEQAFDDTKFLVADLERFVEDNQITSINVLTGAANYDHVGKLAAEMINRLNSAYLLSNTLTNYISSFTTTDSYNTEAMRLYSQVQALNVRIEQTEKLFGGWIGALGDDLTSVIDNNPTNLAHEFYLVEAAQQSQYLMSDSEESLASELSLSGLRAWYKLQGTITSQLKIDFDYEGKTQSLPMVLSGSVLLMPKFRD
jgi:oligoendopeptidase F